MNTTVTVKGHIITITEGSRLYPRSVLLETLVGETPRRTMAASLGDLKGMLREAREKQMQCRRLLMEATSDVTHLKGRIAFLHRALAALRPEDDKIREDTLARTVLCPECNQPVPCEHIPF